MAGNFQLRTLSLIRDLTKAEIIRNEECLDISRISADEIVQKEEDHKELTTILGGVLRNWKKFSADLAPNGVVDRIEHRNGSSR